MGVWCMAHGNVDVGAAHGARECMWVQHMVCAARGAQKVHVGAAHGAQKVHVGVAHGARECMWVQHMVRVTHGACDAWCMRGACECSAWCVQCMVRRGCMCMWCMGCQEAHGCGAWCMRCSVPPWVSRSVGHEGGCGI